MELGQGESHFRISMQTRVENSLMTIESCNRQFQGEEKEREAVEWGGIRDLEITCITWPMRIQEQPSLRKLSAEGSSGFKKWDEWCWEW